MSHLSRRLEVSAPVERFFGYYPGVVSVITAAHGDQRNVMSAGWHAALSAEPPLYGVAIAPERFTYELIVKSESFAVHFLPFEHAAAIAGAGSLSGRDGPDKLALLGLEWQPGAVVAVPILQDAYLAYECRLCDRLPTGDHDWLVGEVMAVHHRPEAFDERFLKHGAAVPATVYYGRSTYEALGSGERAEFHPETFRKLIKSDT